MMGFLNLKRIALAMLIYERDHRTLPPAYTVDADGTPLHSWRVLLLPYLGQVPQSAAEQGSHRHGSQSRPAPSNGIGSQPTIRSRHDSRWRRSSKQTAKQKN